MIDLLGRPKPIVLAWHDKIQVVRDDLCPGGTKRRALDKVLPHLGYEEFCFTAPAQGFAQLALALSCRDLGLKATVFVAKRNELAPRTAAARDAGANIMEVPAGRLSVLRARARAYCERQGALLFPMGFAIPPLLAEFEAIARGLKVRPKEVWVVAGSGALSRSLQAAWPLARHYAVRIGFPPDAGGATLLEAPERFEQGAAMPPPFPSCSTYDAKAWRFIRERASPGALFWNVAA